MTIHSKQDPTGQSRNRKRTTKALDVRLSRAEKKVKALFRMLPRESSRVTVVVNEQVTEYTYAYDAQTQAQFEETVQFILNQELLESQDQMPPEWYYQDLIEPPYRQGASEEVIGFNQLVTTAVIAGLLPVGIQSQPVELGQALFSQEYRESLQSVYVSNYAQIKGLSQKASSQVMQQVNAGIQAKNTPSQITKAITDRFDVSKSDAKRIADTEVNKAYNDGIMNTNDELAKDKGLRSIVIHISALLPTTRNNHAARHGNAYTSRQQNEWWNQGANRINCKCSVEPSLVNSNGEILNKQFQDEIKNQRKFFDK